MLPHRGRREISDSLSSSAERDGAARFNTSDEEHNGTFSGAAVEVYKSTGRPWYHTLALIVGKADRQS
jgi:hypothetical protein